MSNYCSNDFLINSKKPKHLPSQGKKKSVSLSALPAYTRVLMSPGESKAVEKKEMLLN